MKDRVLLTGTALAILAFLLQLAFDALGIEVDLGLIEDGALTLFEVLEIAGLFLMAWSRKLRDAILAEFDDNRTKK